MGLLLRIVFWFFILLIFSSLVFTSFFSDSQPLSSPQFHLPELPQTLTGVSDTTQVVPLFPYEYLMIQGAKIDIPSDMSEDVVIQIPTNTQVMSSLRDITKNYSFSWNGYSVTQEWVGEIFIDTQTIPWKVSVYTLSTPASITLTDIQKEEVYTHIYLDPHMYVTFDPSRGKFLKNADAIRVQTIYTLGYLDEIESLTSTHPFFAAWLSLVRDTDAQLQKNLVQLKDVDVENISGSKWIERYAQLFVNKEKKTVFYKNIVLEKLLQLAVSETYNFSDIEKLNKDYDTLKSLSVDAYNDLKTLEHNLKYSLYSDSWETTIIPKIAYGNIELQQKDIDAWYFPIYGFSLFTVHDIQQTFSLNVLDRFLKSFPAFVASHEDTQKQQQLRYEYFWFMLQNELSYLLHQDQWVQNIWEITKLFEHYIQVADIAFASGGETQNITSLYIYSTMIQELANFLRKQAFLADTTTNNLLRIDTKNRISPQNITTLKRETDEIYTIYEKNKKYLDTLNARDRAISQNFSATQKRIDEYFLALENYELYTAQYDTTKKGILELDTFTSAEDDINTTTLQSYLSQFLWADTRSIDITRVDSQLYRVSNYIVQGKNFSFEILPYQSYKIQNISVNNEPLRYSYKLEIIESDWEEKWKTATQDEKQNYEFSRFFLNTFFEKNTRRVEEYIVNKPTEAEDKSEIVFKRDKLVWGEFVTIRTIAPIEYNHITLKRKGQWYDIAVSWVPLNMSSWDQSDTYYGRFNADYILSSTDHYFTNMKVLFYSESTYANNTNIFPRSTLQIVWNLDIADFSSQMQKLSQQLPYYKELYTEIWKVFPQTFITIQYTLRNQKTTFKFDSWGKNYTILLNGDTVEKAYKGTQKLISSPVKINDFIPVLN